MRKLVLLDSQHRDDRLFQSLRGIFIFYLATNFNYGWYRSYPKLTCALRGAIGGNQFNISMHTFRFYLDVLASRGLQKFQLFWLRLAFSFILTLIGSKKSEAGVRVRVWLEEEIVFRATWVSISNFDLWLKKKKDVKWRHFILDLLSEMMKCHFMWNYVV